MEIQSVSVEELQLLIGRQQVYILQLEKTIARQAQDAELMQASLVEFRGKVTESKAEEPGG